MSAATAADDRDSARDAGRGRHLVTWWRLGYLCPRVFNRRSCGHAVSFGRASKLSSREVATSYRGAEAVAEGAVVTFPVSALAPVTGDEQPVMRVPVVSPRLGEPERLLAEVHFELHDGEHLVFLNLTRMSKGRSDKNSRGATR